MFAGRVHLHGEAVVILEREQHGELTVVDRRGDRLAFLQAEQHGRRGVVVRNWNSTRNAATSCEPRASTLPLSRQTLGGSGLSGAVSRSGLLRPRRVVSCTRPA